MIGAATPPVSANEQSYGEVGAGAGEVQETKAAVLAAAAPSH